MSQNTSTDERIARLQNENMKLQEQNEVLRQKILSLTETVTRLQDQIGAASVPSSPQRASFSMQEIKHDDQKLAFYTGFQGLERFLVFAKFVETGFIAHKEENMQGRPSALSVEDQLLLVLCRLRVGLLEQDLAYRFGVHISTVSRVWTFWVDFLSGYLTQVDWWPTRDITQRYMPHCFLDSYPTTRVILDCTELFIETPSDYNVQSDTYSTYKSHNTAKGLIAVSPNGYVAFASDLAPGRMSDKGITQQSGICSLLEEGDSVMADRGFLIEEDLAKVGVKLNIPPFLKGKAQLSEEEERETREIARLRIHVERVIGQVKNFRMLKFVFPNTMANRLNSVWKICAFLCNFVNEPLVDRTKVTNSAS